MSLQSVKDKSKVRVSPVPRRNLAPRPTARAAPDIRCLWARNLVFKITTRESSSCNVSPMYYERRHAMQNKLIGMII